MVNNSLDSYTAQSCGLWQ